MPRVRDPSRGEAFEIYKQHNGKIDLVEIASQLNLPAGTIRGWKAKDKWEQLLNGTLQKNTERSKRKKGGQPGNKNADGGPPGNKHAEKFGFFSKYLPEETKEIFDAVADADPIDLLWHQIQLAYTAIVRAQSIMYIKDRDDLTKELKRQKESSGEKSDSWEKEYELQFAWDKQANFMKAQARAQGELRSLIKQYDELLHNNWELATEEQKARIAILKAKVNPEDDILTEDDGFIEALQGKVADVWSDE